MRGRSTMPVLKHREVIATLRGMGLRKCGNAARTFACATLWAHHDSASSGARDISPMLLRRIAKDVGLTVCQDSVR